MTTVAAIYARISQDRRKGTDDEGLTVDAQIALCRTWIERQGWTVGTIYRDDSISATTGDTRPGFERLLADKPQHVVYRHQDRLVRTLEDTIRVLASGIVGHGTDGSTLDGTSASAEMVSYITAAVSQNEGRLKAERIRAAHLRDAQAGRYRGNSRPFGQERDGTWVKAEAQAIRQAVSDLLEGRTTFYAVAASWNEQGLLPPKVGKKGGTSWSGGKVSIFFQNPRLKGFQTYADETYPLKDWTPLLSEDEWDQMQSIIDSRRVGTHGRKRHDIHLLTNILKCGAGTCRSGLTASSRNGHRIYRCPKGKGHVSVKADLVEKIVREEALRLLSRKSEADEDGTGKRLADLRHERRTIETASAQWRKTAGAESYPDDMIRAHLEATAQKLAALDEQIVELEAAQGLDLFTNNGAGWDNSPISKRRELLETLFDGITVPLIGRGRRITPEGLTWNYTPLAVKYIDIYVADEAPDTSSWAALRGREPRRREGWVPDSQPHDPEDPWSSLNVT